MCPLRPDIQYATKELTRAVQKPDQHDKQNAKHLLKYLGTKNYKLHLKPKQPTNNEPTSKPTATAIGQDALRRESQLQ
eukprot:4857645-Amphidinium_carterae.1